MTTTKILFTLGIAFLLASTLFVAQANATGDLFSNSPSPLSARPVGTKYSVGLWGGVNYTKTRFDGSFYMGTVKLLKSEFRLGPSVGVSGSVRTSKGWSWQTGIIIDQRGMFYSNSSYIPWDNNTTLETHTEAHLKLNYWTVPIMVQRHFGRVLDWYIEVGTCFSYLKTAKTVGEVVMDMPNVFDGTVESVKSDFDAVASSNYGHDLCGIGGLGFIVPLQKGLWGPSLSLVFNARYYHGLINVYKGEDADALSTLETINPDIEIEMPEHPNDGQSVKNSSFNFSVGLVYAI